MTNSFLRHFIIQGKLIFLSLQPRAKADGRMFSILRLGTTPLPTQSEKRCMFLEGNKPLEENWKKWGDRSAWTV